MNIEQLKQEERNLRDLLDENITKQRELNTAAFVAKHGVDIGDTIEFLDGRNTSRGVVCEFEYSNNSPYWVVVRVFKLDGTLGARKRTVWGFPQSITKITKKS